MRTYNAKLVLLKEDEEKLRNTLRLHSLAWNKVSQFLFKKKVLVHTIVHKKTYKAIRKEFPDMPSQVVIKARMDCIAAYRTAKSNKVKLEEPMQRNRLAMRLDTCLFRLKREMDGSLWAMFTVAGNRRNRIKARIVSYLRLEEMMKYELADPLVFEKDGQFWLAMSFRTPEATYVADKCVGVDLGLRRLAATSDGLIIKLPVHMAARRRIRYQKRMLHEVKARLTRKKNQSARRKLRKLRRKERNQSKQICHLVANRLLETKASTIVLEDLSKLKENTKHQGRRHNNRLSQMPFCALRTILTYKAQALGKRVETVDPRYTSKDDYRGIPRGVRKGCRYLASDGKVLDADHNAAINIAQRWTARNEHPVSFASPERGRQTLWAGRSQPADSSAPMVLQAAGL